MIATYNNLGLLHSYDDQPALVDDNGNQFWLYNGVFHRDQDLPAVILKDHKKKWYNHGLFFKKELCYDSFKKIEFYDKMHCLHNMNGPANLLYEKDNQGKYQTISADYYIHGKKLTKDDFDNYYYHKYKIIKNKRFSFK